MLIFVCGALAQQGLPEPVTVGFGVGVLAPTYSFGPNVASARVRLTRGFTLSPTAGYAYTTTRTGAGESAEDDTVTGDVSLSVGGEVLGAAARRGTALLQLVGGARFGADTVTVDPDEPIEHRTETRTFDVYYGLGVEWFLGANEPHVSLSAHGLNPAVSEKPITGAPPIDPQLGRHRGLPRPVGAGDGAAGGAGRAAGGAAAAEAGPPERRRWSARCPWSVWTSFLRPTARPAAAGGVTSLTERVWRNP